MKSKGISQVVASALLLAVAIAVAGVYANWAPNLAEKTGQDIADQSDKDIKCRNVGFNVENITYDRSAAHTIVRVRNTGTINLRDDVSIVTLNDSEIIGSKTIGQLEVDEKVRTTVTSDYSPDQVVVSSKGCPEADIETTEISTQD